MPLLPYDYLHLVNCPEVVIISDILCSVTVWKEGEFIYLLIEQNRPSATTNTPQAGLALSLAGKIDRVKHISNAHRSTCSPRLEFRCIAKLGVEVGEYTKRTENCV